MTADLTEEQFERSITLNLKSVWLCMKEEIRQMIAQQPSGGAILNTSSVNGLGGTRQAAFYAAAKAGVLALSKSAALEYARHRIRINALVAGAFSTPMLESVFDRVSGGNPEARQAVVGRYEDMVALGRIGRPEEAAEAALWLCSDAASYVTGHSMIVDGGLTAPVR
jgi:NAD(P)-dependent dehydrogenase (short-subunit alcohol dehydrogenase family)